MKYSINIQRDPVLNQTWGDFNIGAKGLPKCVNHRYRTIAETKDVLSFKPPTSSSRWNWPWTDDFLILFINTSIYIWRCKKWCYKPGWFSWFPDLLPCWQLGWMAPKDDAQPAQPENSGINKENDWILVMEMSLGLLFKITNPQIPFY